jgi:predicted dehydrogenase/nucleoside-diphosphate-sugar epimerase
MPISGGRKVKTLVAGAGYIADYHLAILSENPAVELAGICDPHQERLQALALRWKIPRAEPTMAALVASGEADAVHVLTPPHTHRAVITEALEAGLHVLAEKPMALSLAETDSLMQLAIARGVRLDANHNAAWHPQFLRLKADIAARRLGGVQHVLAVQNVPLAQLAAGAHSHWMFSDPRNVLFEQGPHPMSQICDLLGPVRHASTTCSGQQTLRTGATFFDTWQVSLSCERGTAQLYMAFDGAFPYWQLHVVGQDATARLDLLANTYVLDRATPSVPPVDALRRGVRRGAVESAGAIRQMAHYVSGTLKITGRRDPYYVSMKESIDAFHRRLHEGAPDVVTPLDRHVAAALDTIASAVPVVPARAADAGAPAIVKSSERADVLVIGATGFIGPHLVAALAEQGQTVRVMARSPRALPDQVRRRASSVAEGDVRDAAAVAAAIRGCKRVVHLVASAPEGWSAYERLYIDGTRHVADACLASGVEQLQFASSIAALYLGRAGDVVTNTTPPDAEPDDRCDYAKAKILCERMLLELKQTRNLPVVIVRPGIVVGAGGPPQHLGVGHWPARTLCITWGIADHPLPFVLAGDVARAMATLSTRTGFEGRAFNLAGDVKLRASEYVAALAQLSQRDIRLKARSLTEWWVLEHFGWAVKAIGRKANNSALSWRELTYRTGAATLDCSDTKRDLGWHPEADRDRFIAAGIAAAIRP